MNDNPDTTIPPVKPTGYRIIHREIPKQEGSWTRHGNFVRLKLIDLEPALPPEVDLSRIRSFRVLVPGPGGPVPIASHIDATDGYGRWTGQPSLTADSQIGFHSPADGQAPVPSAGSRWRPAGRIDLRLWDSRDRACLEGVQVEYSLTADAPRIPSPDTLRLVRTARGYAVKAGRTKLLHFDADREYQVDYAAPTGTNLVPQGLTWRWLPTETVTEMKSGSGGTVDFEPVMDHGLVLVVRVRANVKAGRVETTLRMFRHAGALVLEFSDYRAVRSRPEQPPEQHARCYAGQIASPVAGIHYAAFMVAMRAGTSTVQDHLFKHQPVNSDHPLSFVYVDALNQKGWNWMALTDGAAAVGITAHGRSHYPDQPFKAGREGRHRFLALEPWGSEVDGHYHSCDRHMLVLADSVDRVREVFDTLDTFPVLVSVPVQRRLAFLDTFECLCRWANLNFDHLMRDGHYRNALRTDGTPRNDTDTCVNAISEMIRLYEKTGWVPFRETALKAARFTARWILDGRFHTRGTGVGANGGGIYQNEQIYLLLALARTLRITGDPLLRQAIDHGVRWLDEHRGGQGTWGWDQYLWHSGGWAADGTALYYWPVNTNQYATLNFRLYQLLGDRVFLENAMGVMNDYFQHIRPDSWEIIKGGGVSDTTRGVHLLAEAIEAGAGDPRIDAAFLRQCVEKTLDRFWIEGWIMVRHSTYAEVIKAGDTPGDLFSPGYNHWHNCGSHLDPVPRIAVAAEVGVSPHLTRWALRDFIYDFDMRFGVEEHTHLTRYSMRDTDIEPACWLDCELLPALYASARRDWVNADDFRLMHYKIHRMLQRTFITLDPQHGGWANAYDSHDGAPLKYLTYWEHRHSFERFAPDEPLEMWGVPTRDAFYDHSSHYWSPTEALVDELVRAETVTTVNGRQEIRCTEDGLAAGMPIPRPALVPCAAGAKTLALAAGQPWRILETRHVTVHNQPFWLVALAACGKTGLAAT
ncbi:MAG: hypothetical protein A2340_00570 [Lentisphaerae bacterium RIFOXYB12_FULL_60_10]|nr:MAG: hypothetical protein A2340_00570 [Lentisphaerae bacterium RIFOXYB12_FULL_60_10]